MKPTCGARGNLMRVLLLYDYPPSPGGLATQGDLLYRGLLAIGVGKPCSKLQFCGRERMVLYAMAQAGGCGGWYWLLGRIRRTILYPVITTRAVTRALQLVADGYIAGYREVLNALPLIL